MMNRRRFLAISAAALATPASATLIRWHGHAMGAEVSLTFDASATTAEPAIAMVRSILEKCEASFSLYRQDSALSRLNQTGRLRDPGPEFLRLMRDCAVAHDITEGRFDPTVQPLWAAAARGEDISRAQQLVGWDRVRVTADSVELDAGQALTLNGIAQGFATDRVVEALRQSGWSRVLVNIGEFYAGGRIWTLGISDPQFGLVDTRKLKDRAIATSSPGALHLRSGDTHILNPKGQRTPMWSTLSVEAADATTADALSTALCHATEAEIAAILARAKGAPSATCVAANGKVRTIRA